MSADAHVLTPASLSGRTIGLLRKERLGPRSLRAHLGRVDRRAALLTPPAVGRRVTC